MKNDDNISNDQAATKPARKSYDNGRHRLRVTSFIVNTFRCLLKNMTFIA